MKINAMISLSAQEIHDSRITMVRARYRIGCMCQLWVVDRMSESVCEYKKIIIKNK